MPARARDTIRQNCSKCTRPCTSVWPGGAGGPSPSPHRDYATSAYNCMASAGAEIVRHGTAAEGLVQLKEALVAMTGKAWLNFYWGAPDTLAPVTGPGR